MRNLGLSLMLTTVVACGGGGSGDTDGMTESESSSSDDSGIMSVGPEKLDVLGGMTGAGDDSGATTGCEKVDFLFVIDSSNSMATNQAELIASFPEFVSGIQSTLTDVSSIHVGVVTSDAYEFNGDGCTEIGALVTETGGKDSGNAVCSPYASGSRFMTEEDDLPTAFSCAALIGTGGANDERMMEGALSAVGPDLNAAGACNEGFIRDDALLVLVLITDEDDPGTCVSGGQSCEGSPGDPDRWYDDLVEVKVFPQNVVALSLTRGAPDNQCGAPEGTELDGDRIMQFVGRFGATGLIGDICADSFGTFFNDAISLIDNACGGFVDPVG